MFFFKFVTCRSLDGHGLFTVGLRLGFCIDFGWLHFDWKMFSVVDGGCARKIDHSAKFNFDARTQSNLPNDRFNCMLFPKPQCIDCGRWWRQLSVQCHSSSRCDARIPVLWLGLLARNTVARRRIYWGMVGRIIASTVQRSNEWCNLITSTYLKNDDDYSLSH